MGDPDDSGIVVLARVVQTASHMSTAHDLAWSPPIPPPLLELLQRACGARIAPGRLVAMLDAVGGPLELVHADPARLAPFIGRAAAVRLHAAAQLGVQVAEQPANAPDRAPLRVPHDAAPFFQPVLRGRLVEQAWVLLLDRGVRPLALRRLSEGSDRGTILDSRQVLRLALQWQADALIVAHNHPTGDCSPSADDLRSTRQLVAAGNVVGVRVVDHLIFAQDAWSSFALQGLL
jgi:DNA repair protein RadC